jgi:serine/threonine protein phosphatase PrpC
MLGVETALLTSAGGRDHNEDCCGYRMTETAGCWVLADGLGGHRGGATASRLAVEAALTRFDASPQAPMDHLTEAAELAIRIAQQREPELESMRTTFAALHVSANGARWIHCGDSRVYWFRDGSVCEQTLDHSVPGALAAAGEISRDAIRGHEDRSRLLRSLGNRRPAEPAISASGCALRIGDVFLLASDGFWEWVEESAMEADLRSTATPGKWLDLMEDRLKSRADARHDNYSAIAIRVTNGGALCTPKVVV